MEDFSGSVDVDVSESFQPFFQEWGSVQELAGIPLDGIQRETLGRLKRPTSVPPRLSSRGDSEDEIHAEFPGAGPLGHFEFRSYSFGSENSLDVRARRSSYEYSMDTLWSSSSTFSINIDHRDDEDDETAGIYIDNALRNNEVFVGGSEPNLLEGRTRENTLSSQDYPKEVAAKTWGSSLEVEKCSKESLETVTGEETPRPDRTEEEIKTLLDDVIQRIVDTCKRLSVCTYTPDDSVEEVERKLRESKVCHFPKLSYLHLSIKSHVTKITEYERRDLGKLTCVILLAIENV